MKKSVEKVIASSDASISRKRQFNICNVDDSNTDINKMHAHACANVVNSRATESDHDSSYMKKMRQVKNTENDENIANNNNSSDFGESFWRDNYYKLRDSRDEDYDDVESELQIRKQKESKLQNLLDLIEKSSGVSNIQGVIEAKNNEIKQLASKIKLYETMTCMTIKQQSGSSDESGGCSHICTVKNINNRSIVRFSVERREGSDAVLFEPKANLQLFPEHLQGKIQCPAPMAPVFLADVTQNIFKDE